MILTESKMLKILREEYENRLQEYVNEELQTTYKAGDKEIDVWANADQCKVSHDESGIMYRAGVKKYGKAGMKAIQSAAGKGASHQEIGKIKDKHLKDQDVSILKRLSGIK